MYRSISRDASDQYAEIAACEQMLLTNNPDRQLTDTERAIAEKSRKHAHGLLAAAIDESDVPDDVKEKAHALRRAIAQRFAFNRMAAERKQRGEAITPGVQTRLDEAASAYETAKKDLSDAMKAHRIPKASHGQTDNAKSKGSPDEYARGGRSPRQPDPQPNSPTGGPSPAPSSGSVALMEPDSDPGWSYDNQVLAYEATGMSRSDAQAAVEGAYKRATEYEEEARKRFDRAQESFERSDTDGFLSQYAATTIGDEYMLKADIARRGGTHEFPVLLRDGKPVPARVIETRHGPAWAVFASADEANADRGEIVEFVGLGPRSAANKGYSVGTQIRVARTAISSNGVTAHSYPIPGDGMRFNPDAPYWTS